MSKTLWAVALLAAAAAAPAWGQLALLDTEMADSRWSTVKVYDTTSPHDATGNSFQSPSGGLPGAYRLTVHDWQIEGGGVSIAFAHLHSGATWNPAGAGAILSVSVAYDANCFTAPHVNAVGTNLVALQGGQFFYAVTQPFGGVAIAGAGWNQFTGTFTQADFAPMGGSSGSIDFSSTGGLIQFGYYTANGGSGADFRNDATLGVDNFELVIIPAPAGLAGLAGVVLLRRRRRPA